MFQVRAVLAVTGLFVCSVLASGLCFAGLNRIGLFFSILGTLCGGIASIVVDPDLVLSIEAVYLATACMALATVVLHAYPRVSNVKIHARESLFSSSTTAEEWCSFFSLPSDDETQRVLPCAVSVIILAFIFQTSVSSAQCFAQPQSHSEIQFLVPSQSVHLQHGYHLDFNISTGTLNLFTSNQSLVFSSTPGESFLIGALEGSFDAPNGEEMGIYDFKDKAASFSSLQTVETVFASPDAKSVSVRGFLEFGATLVHRRIPYVFDLAVTSPDLVTFHARSVSHKTLKRIYLRHSSSSKEGFYGFGLQYSYSNMKGGCVPIFTQEQGIGRGLQPISFLVNFFVKHAPGSWQTSYAPAAYYMTSDSRAMYLTNEDFALFDLTRPNAVTIEVNASSIHGAFVVRDTPLGIIETYTREHAGRMRKLPSWVGNGAVLGLQGGTAAVQAHVSKLKNAGVPIAALWLQDWTGKRETGFGRRLQWNWEVSESHYPGWYEYIRKLARENIYVMSYINPYLANTGGGSNESTSLFQEAMHHDCLVKESDGITVQIQASATPDFTFGTVDLTNPNCQDWYIHEVIQERMLGNTRDKDHVNGVIGFMADFAESISMGAKLDAGEGSELHNRFPVLWAETCRKAISSSAFLEENAVFFTRAGGAKTPGQSTLMWMGDQMTTYDHHDGLRSALAGMLSAGMSGFSLAHSDIGGYTMFDRFGIIRVLRSPELFMRWAEMNVFSDAMFRTHEGVLPDLSTQAVNDKVIDHFAKFARLHTKLFTLVKEPLMKVAQASGAPLARHMFLEFPNDTKARLAKDQFLLGSDLLICPIVMPGKTERLCYIPEGNWTHTFTHEKALPQSEFRCSAPLGQPCVFYRPQAAKIARIIRDVLLA